MPTNDTLDVAVVSAGTDRVIDSVVPVQSLDAEAISRRSMIRLDEALNAFAGVSVKDYGGIGGLKTVSVRNMGASHTSVIYDGIAISNAQNGQVDISHFNLDDISSVRLCVGTDDDIFTSARHMTSAGTLKIKTGRTVAEAGRTDVSARLTVSSFNTYNPYVSIVSRFDETHMLSVSADGLYSEGGYPFKIPNGDSVIESERSGSDVLNGGGEIDYCADWKSQGVLKVKGMCHFSERGLPGPVIYYTEYPSERLWDRSFTGNASYEVSPMHSLKIHTDIGLLHSYNCHLDPNPSYPAPQESTYIQNEYSIAARALYEPLRNWSFCAAADFFVNSLDSDIPECPFPVRFSFAGALTGQYRRNNLHLTATLASTYVSESLRIGQAPSDRFRLSPALGMNWRIAEGLHIRSSIKDGYRIPTFNELYYSRVGNRNLQPEKALQLNLGVVYEERWKCGRCSLTADTYFNKVRDKISAVPTMFIWKMRNIGEAVLYGVDITGNMDLKASGWLDIVLGGTYSLQYALDVTDPEGKNYMHQIPYVPLHCSNAYVIFELPWFNLSYRFTAAGKRYFSQQNLPQNRLEPYFDHCMSVSRSFEICRRYIAEVSIDALNLADVNYELINNYPMPGRSFRLSVKFRKS